MSTEVKPRNRKFIRSEKTGRAIDDFKVLFVGTLLAVVLMLIQVTYIQLSEQRWFRDMTMKSPFHSVVVSDMDVSPSGKKITITGWMTKRRCVFSSLTGYVIDDAGERTRVYVNTTPEDVLTGSNGDRPASNKSERWGPWQISLRIEKKNPVSWEIWAHHICPEDRNVQSNLFAEGSWITKHLK